MRIKGGNRKFWSSALLAVVILQLGAAETATAGEPPLQVERPEAEAISSTGQKNSTVAKPAPLVAGIEVFQPHSLLGQWNGHIQRFRRHPKLFISYCEKGVIEGTYKGIFGKFPVSGNYEEETGNITIHVDFSSSFLTRLKKLKSGKGLIEANIKDGVLVGRASIPDLGPKSVRWEAVKAESKYPATELDVSPK